MKRFMIKLLLMMLAGFTVGFGMGLFSDQIANLSFSFDPVTMFIYEQILYIQLTLFTLMLVPLYISLFKANSTIKKINTNLDIENDQAEKRFQKLYTAGAVLNRIMLVSNFILMAFASNDGNQYILITSIIFIVIFFLASVNEVLTLKMYQLYDPSKKGDPYATNFPKKLFAGYDEAEKLEVYQAAYSTFRVMEQLLLWLLLVGLIGRVMFDLSTSIIVLIGLIWLAHSLTYYYFGTKQTKNQIIYSDIQD
ncbi:Protein of unknown function [Amphibacillus marinus]|uniref:DUF3169 domain-containing protein n=1 Tax=Amphibacillus marinus TaxID=872970 RepID=A0A1H8INJ1_9BACI|nr:DUF3169 family protein [Amphibacillus marinus]SEN69675.1 Protein of unknown function [Amphibacillus marinus]